MKQSRHEVFLKERERGFDLDFGVRAKLPEYNALRDRNMRHYFENYAVQEHLCRTGQIDKSGRVIDLEKNKSKLFIIEREFERAEAMERNRQKDEEDARHIVRLQKLRHLEESKKAEKVRRIKEDRMIQRDIATATREAMGLISPPLLSSSLQLMIEGDKGERGYNDRRRVWGREGGRKNHGRSDDGRALAMYERRRKK